MPTTNLTTRLTVEGGAEIISTAKAVGEQWASSASGAERYLNKTVAEAGKLEELYERLAARSRASAEAEAQRAATMERNANIAMASGVKPDILPGSLAGASAAVFQEFFKSQEAAEALRRELDPLYSAQVKYNDKVAELTTLFDQGMLKEDEFSAHVDRATEAFNRQHQAIQATVTAAEQLSLTQSATPVQARIDNLLAPRTDPAVDFARRAYEADYLRLLEQQEREVHALKVALDPMVAAQDRYNAAIAKANELKPHIGVELYDKAIKQAHADLERFERSQLSNRGAQLSAGQLQNLSFQLNDVITGLMSGQHAEQIFAQQGGQIFQALQMGEGGVTGSLKALSKFLNPAVVGISALTVAMVAGGVAAYRYADAQDHLTLSLMGIGRGSGATASQLQALAETQSKIAGISVGAARDQEVSYLNLGVTSTDVIGRLIAVSKNYALVTGQDAATASERLGRAMAAPDSAGLELLRSLDLLNGKTQEYIESLERRGEHEIAQEVVLGKVSAAVDGASDRVNLLRQRWDELGNAISGAFDRLGQFIDRQYSMDPDAVAARYRQQNTTGGRIGGDLGSAAGVTAAAFLPGGALLNLLPNNRVSKNQADSAAQQRADDMRMGIMAMETKNRSYIENAANKGFNTLAPGDKQREVAQQYFKAVKAGYDAGTISAEQLAEAQKGLDNQLKAIDKRENPSVAGAGRAGRLAREADSVRVNTAQSLLLAEAYLKDDAAAMRAEAARKALTEATRKGIDTDAAMQRQLALTLAETAASGARNIAVMRDRTAAQATINAAIADGTIKAGDAGDQMQLELARRPLLTAMALAEGEAKAILARELAALTDAYRANARAADVGRMLAENDTTRDNIELLRVQLGLVKATASERAIALAQYKAQKALDDSHLADASDPYNRRKGQLLGRSLGFFDKVTEAQIQAKLDRRTQAEAMRKDQADRIASAQLELSLLSRNPIWRQRELDLLAVKQQLVRDNISAESEEGRAILANADIYAQLNLQIERQGAYYDGLREAQKSAFDEFRNLVKAGNSDWQDWQQAGLNAIKAISDEMLALALFNPMSNWLFGTNLPTAKEHGGLGGVAGDFIGSLFGGFSGSTSSSRAAGPSSGGRSSGALGGAVPHHAMGTNYAPGGLSMLAEDDIELLIKPQARNIPRGSKVLSGRDTRALLAGGGGAAMAPSGPTIVKIDATGLAAPMQDMFRALESNMNTAIAAGHKRTLAAAARQHEDISATLYNDGLLA